MKHSPNAPCPCHSGEKYKKCCQPYHRGSFPSTAFKLMRSRYSAYALHLADYIIHTTHSNNPDFTDNTLVWRDSILEFCHTTQFIGLKILEFTEEKGEAFVTFEAKLSEGIMREKSRFLKVSGKWLYESGEFSETDSH
jgi:SEC-C motif-containing protein